jgi:hypothetical protein
VLGFTAAVVSHHQKKYQDNTGLLTLNGHVNGIQTIRKQIINSENAAGIDAKTNDGVSAANKSQLKHIHTVNDKVRVGTLFQQPLKGIHTLANDGHHTQELAETQSTLTTLQIAH